jgi:phenylacetate-CoA ligase
MGTINSVVKKSPIFIKKAYYNIVPFEFRYGKVFRDTYNNIFEHLEYDYKKLKEYQFSELKKILIHCEQNVPFYNKIFKEYSFNPNNMQDFSDINILPYLTKDIIRENYEDLIATNYKNKKLYTLKTSGSTGKKLQFLAADETYKKEAAFILRAYKDHGATLYDKPSIWLRRYVPDDKEKPLWTYDEELKRLYMSAYHLNNDTLKNYLKEISKKDYHTLVGYPSSIYALAILLEETGKNLNIKSIHTASEMMLPQWKEKIENVFGIKVKSHYGQMEKVSLFYQDFQDDLYKECLDYS